MSKPQPLTIEDLKTTWRKMWDSVPVQPYSDTDYFVRLEAAALKLLCEVDQERINGTASRDESPVGLIKTAGE